VQGCDCLIANGGLLLDLTLFRYHHLPSFVAFITVSRLLLVSIIVVFELDLPRINHTSSPHHLLLATKQCPYKHLPLESK
jgi:hypothetical protein